MKKIGIALVIFTLSILCSIIIQINVNQVKQYQSEPMVNWLEHNDLETYELTLAERIGS